MNGGVYYAEEEAAEEGENVIPSFARGDPKQFFLLLSPGRSQLSLQVRANCPEVTMV